MNNEESQDQNELTSQSRDNDSALGLDSDFDQESTQSLTSSLMNFTYENGRRYHAYRAGQYFMPNDEQEQQAMDLLHHISLMILGGELFRAPIVDPKDILDIGTGTGIWSIDVADKYPAANVIATDLSPIQPTWAPPNLDFQVDDCEHDWTFTNKFDMIHMRNLNGSISDWPALLQKSYDHLKPGGWIECTNVTLWAESNNGSMTEESASYQWQVYLKKGAAMARRELILGDVMEDLIKQAGFEDVINYKYMIPLSPWYKGREQITYYFLYLTFIEFEAVSLRLFVGVLGWPPERLQDLIAGIKKEISDPANEMYIDIHYMYGRKPMS